MGTFENDKEFDKYLEEIKKTQEDKDKQTADGLGGLGDLSTTEESASPKSEGEESITNVQEQGVDEGDIVKVYKDYFVILRRGRIFTVKISDGNALKAISHINAYPEGYTQGTWYDEMLIYQDKIVVIGYSYDMEATEIGLFSINDSGELKHLSHYFIDSNDYYSSRNYASRLIDNQLILYMPYYLYSYDYFGEEYKQELTFPKIYKWVKGDELSEGKDILQKTDIYKPVQDIDTPTLHTVVSCDIASSELDCSGKAVMGPYSRNFYVSPNAIYLWVSDINYYYYDDEELDKIKNEPDSYVYMIKLDDMSARALRADAGPTDQFSFKEEDNYLNVLVREYSGSDAMWNPEVTEGALALFRVPLDKFTDTPEVISQEYYQDLPNISGYTLQNRFVGDYVLYGTGSTWYYDEKSEDKLYLKKYTEESEAERLDLQHGVERIDIMGKNAVIIGNKDENLKFSSIDLSDIKVKDTYDVGRAAQGELRSHGFSYKDNKDGTGILGLPIIRTGESFEHLFSASAEILFLKANQDLSFAKLGTLKGSAPREENDNCEYSCVDWYGNSRPIFYSDRIFGLMGYELLEGELKAEEITEKGKVNFTP
ncbi:MAG: beta-propeller domain-containing protein [Candidatus Thorarchaeota archaeon]